MKTARKGLMLVLCAALLVSATVMGTLAYLTDEEAVTNTFTIGSVGLKLDEAVVKTDGAYVSNETNRTETGNEYHLLPGHSYIKDPTVTVDAGSEESYIRMIVTVTFKENLTDPQLATELDGIFTGYNAAKWKRVNKTVADKVITYEYRYHTTVDGKDAAGKDAEEKLEPLFTGFTVPGSYTNDTIKFLHDMTIEVVAHAIQADGFANADAAWAAFNAQQNNS